MTYLKLCIRLSDCSTLNESCCEERLRECSLVSEFCERERKLSSCCYGCGCMAETSIRFIESLSIIIINSLPTPFHLYQKQLNFTSIVPLSIYQTSFILWLLLNVKVRLPVQDVIKGHIGDNLERFVQSRVNSIPRWLPIFFGFKDGRCCKSQDNKYPKMAKGCTPASITKYLA